MVNHFIKPENKEIVCEKCGEKFMGGGYINHCPNCLWSKHVDKDIPGDRKSDCISLMRPVQVVMRKREALFIKHECERCKKVMFNKISDKDNMDIIIQLSTRHDKHGN